MCSTGKYVFLNEIKKVSGFPAMTMTMMTTMTLTVNMWHVHDSIIQGQVGGPRGAPWRQQRWHLRDHKAIPAYRARPKKLRAWFCFRPNCTPTLFAEKAVKSCTVHGRKALEKKTWNVMQGSTQNIKVRGSVFRRSEERNSNNLQFYTSASPSLTLQGYFLWTGLVSRTNRKRTFAIKSRSEKRQENPSRFSQRKCKIAFFFFSEISFKEKFLWCNT